MQKSALSFFLLFLLLVGKLNAQKEKMVITSQGDTFYILPDSKADKLYEKGDIKGAIIAYQKEMKTPHASFSSAHNLACCFTKNGQPDSAFKYLYLDLKTDTSALALSDPDLLPLRSDKGWADFEKQTVAGLQIKYGALIKDFPLAEKLWEMEARDQAYYYEIDLAEKKMGRGCPVSMALWAAKEELNRHNLADLDSIVRVKGWPKISQVGHLASSAAFLVVQHSTLELQQKYLPTIQTLCEQKEADWESYALMYDRVQVGLGKPQRYGSQVKFNEVSKKFELFPIEDEKNVDKRRSEIGMEPLEVYAKNWNINYKLPQ